MNQKVTIIAEAGVNHNGDIALAYKLIDAAVEAGADIVKFQTFKAEQLVTREARQCEYQTVNTEIKESQFAMLKRLELPYEHHGPLISYCAKKGIQFLSTAFDEQSLSFLVNELGLSTLKVPSGEITNGPFLLAHAKTGADIILSTGMSTLADIELALAVLAFGFTTPEKECSIAACQSAYASEAGQKALRQKVTLLHCTSDYPAKLEDINLKAMNTMADAFGVPVGYSDHSEGVAVALAAVARGGVVIEKHFTLDKKLPGPDHKASLEPKELDYMVANIRSVERALGSRIKTFTESEVENRSIVRKNLVTTRAVEAGELWQPDMITAKRSGSGRSPMEYWSLIGSSVVTDLDEEQEI
ncbi:N-acetylneuraminate synthase [Pseudoalteromonas sp. MSK9-3]|uniref:N-acetylneuraminate synthase n=1 Tax=Pseudoalteromonas sp. MSK9-3 TaxID=1897633 RepID=UPI000E6D318C|nr:N-acetylneuraminate synthase [Pseudoalteromonas sp. MSK9-3]RJE77345.1 N-acetylneuraminate synthase [Pseudoalteromonas sp. MSK9-3]